MAGNVLRLINFDQWIVVFCVPIPVFCLVHDVKCSLYREFLTRVNYVSDHYC